MILIPLALRTFRKCLIIAINYEEEMARSWLTRVLRINPGSVSTIQPTVAQVTSLENHKKVLNLFITYWEKYYILFLNLKKECRLAFPVD